MVLSDISVKRPVFATVIALLLLSLGVLCFHELPLREYPDMSPPMVSVQTSYSGASAAVMETKITRVIEDQISGIEGVTSIRSSSSDGSSRISIEFDVGRDIDQAANDVRDKVARVMRRLPEDADPPQIAKADSESRPVLYFSLSGTGMDSMALTDYADRYIVDQFATIDGVASVNLNGAGRYSMRIWLDRVALAARGLTVNDIEATLRRENLELPAGRIDSKEREFAVRVERAYSTAADFASMVVARGQDGHLIRLGEVARVEIGPSSTREEVRANGQRTISMGIVKQSTANTLQVLRAAKAKMAQINESLPEGMELQASLDDSIFIENAIGSVYETLMITLVLVSLVIYLFLGSFRAMMIPAVTIPVSLTASCFVLTVFGFSVNLITLLGLVLAIGLVVDDSIVVLENIQRRIEEGEPPLLAAFNGSRQVGFAVIATTAVLIAVFVPIAFLKGNIGVIFAEFAAVVGGAVFFSAVLALSLTSMLSSKLLKDTAHESWFTRKVDDFFRWVQRGYHAALDVCLPRPWIFVTIVLCLGAGIFVLTETIPTAFAPDEDQGAFMARVNGPEGASFGYMKRQMEELQKTIEPYVESGDVARFLEFLPGWGGNSVNGGVVQVLMVPWEERKKSTSEVMQELGQEWNKIPGVRAFPFMRSGVSRGGGGQPVQFVLGGSTYQELAGWRDIVMARAAENPGLSRVQSDYEETRPQLLVEVDKTRAAALGVSIQAIGRTLQTMMSERRVTTYVNEGEEYDVILQAEDSQRASPDDLANIYVRSEGTGKLIPLSNLTQVVNGADAGSLNRYNRLRAITISANLNPGYTLGEALAFLENVVRTELPPDAQIDYKGESLELKESKGGLFFSFMLALFVVFLVLAAQFESFIHPIVIMMTVPLGTFGALLGIYLTGGTLNMYSEIGLIILVGISTKNGILIVEFANQLRDRGVPFEDALRQAADIRLRPVLMTTIATIMGSIPLMLASGAGAESRTTLGIVIFCGVSLGTILTLFVVPVFYRLLGRRTGSPGTVAANLARIEGEYSSLTVR